ncbi:MAG: hypothetical protein LBH06_04815 [Rikenellaceae bacterium]|jgi:hypothetical protein|nr:hypothetical protein [Rikenellaceae bacterium]
MKRSLLLSAVACVALVATSCCNGSGDVSLVEIKDVDLGDLSHLELKAAIDNGRCQNINVKRGSLALYDSKSKILEITLTESVRIPRNSTSEVTFPIAVRLENPLALITLPRKLRRADNTLNVTGEIAGRMGLLCKKKRVEAMPLNEFLREIGAEGFGSGESRNDLLNLLNL